LKINKKINQKEIAGITLIALVITIIVLLILAGISISMLSGDNGILQRAAEAKEKTEDSQREEEMQLEELAELVKNNGQETGWSVRKHVNAPKVSSGMIPVKYSNGKWVICSQDDSEWYSYDDKQWANVMLCDGKYDTTTAVGTEVAVDDLGSMFVWIPRFAYKITSNYHSNTTGGIDVKFLKGTSSETDDNVTIVEYNETTTNNYTQFPDGYVVHPAFTNDVSKGGWSTQLTGIWVAKFEAGYPMADTEDDATSKTSDNMYYPVFKGKRYSYNNYKIPMLYSMCESMTSSGNPYSITSSSNSHMIKNSEWGAVAYLTRSSYGKESEIYINNVSFENDRKNINNSSVYGLTGYSADAVSRDTNNVSGKDIGDSITGASYTSYVWYDTTNGIYASTTGNITGIYDMSGGCWEYPGGVIPSGHRNINTYGGTIFSTLTASTNKITLYPVGNSTSSKTDISRSYSSFGSMYGDSIWETSSQVGANFSWNGDISDEDTATHEPFFVRGGTWTYGDQVGSFAFADNPGTAYYTYSTRAVLAVQ